MRIMTLWLVASLLLAIATTAMSGVEVVTQHFDNARTGANTQETVLTPATVNVAGFGKQFTMTLDANVNGQALYVPGLVINGGTHNAVFAYTSNNADGSPCSAYAFDADTGAQLWVRHFATNAAKWTTNTPVIDTASKTMFMVSKDNDDNGVNRMRAIDILTGNEKTGSGTAISGSVPGTGPGNIGGTMNFPADHANCRPGLLLLNGVIYCAFSHNSDGGNYHGWVVGYTYDSAGFHLAHIFCDTPNQWGGGIWQAGKGLASDGSAVFCTTGNGNFDAAASVRSYSMCVLRLNPDLTVADYFAPANQANWSNADADLGNCGLVIIPGTSLGFTGSTKYGQGHLVNTNNLGHFSAAADTCLQTLNVGGSVGTNPVAWNGGANKYVYLHGNGVLTQWQVGSTSLSQIHNPTFGSGNGRLCVTSNGTGNGIVWLIEGNTVHALDATNVAAGELWNSNQNSARDSIGGYAQWQFPMVAAGRAYIPDNNKHLIAYGQLTTQTATRLAFAQQPGTVSSGSIITPAVTVAVQDAGGTTVTGSSAAVTIAIAANPGGGTLSGTLTRNASNGVATFANLSINNAGTGYTLTAASGGLSGATSNAFNVLAQGATPTINPNGGSYSGPVTVRFSDATSGAAIHYTTNGATPTGASATYDPANPPLLSATVTVKAIATKSGLSDSAVASTTFSISGSTTYGMPYRPTVSGLNLPATNTNPPALLSTTHLFASLATLTPAAGIVPYNVNTPLWSDAAVKSRWIALPGNSQVVFQSTGEWTFPGGTIFIKHFELGTNDTNPAVRKRLETRLLVLNSSGGGYGITYKWRADNSDADLLSASGLDEAITITTASGTRSQTWHYPSQNECLTCHTANAGFVLGAKTRQLNGTFTYPSTGVSDNQLRTWNYLQMFTSNIGEGNIAGFSRSKALTDTSATLEDRVKSYLDANCAQCHRPGGAVTAWDARYDTPMANQGIINGAVKTDLGIAGALVVVPQQVPLSIMDVRMKSTDSTTKMPPLARNLVDTAAVGVLDQWINSLPTSGPAPVIVDNLDANTSRTGTWNVSGAPNPYNGQSLYSSGSATFTWLPSVPQAGTYQVFAWWTSNANRSTNAPFQITHAGSVNTVNVNQQLLGGQWNLLGSFVFNAGGGQPIQVSSANGEANADAVKLVWVGSGSSVPTIASFTPTSGPVGISVVIAGTNFSGTTTVRFNGTAATAVSVNSATQITATVPVGTTTGAIAVTTPGGTATSSASFTVTAAPTPLIVDNLDANTARTGTWNVSSAPNPYNGQSLYGSGSSTFTWLPNVPLAGTYEVYAWWTSNANRSTSSQYRIAHAGSVDVTQVNQQLLGGQWNLLGTYAFNAGGSQYLEASAASGEASADAVKLVWVTSALAVMQSAARDATEPASSTTNSCGSGGLFAVFTLMFFMLMIRRWR